MQFEFFRIPIDDSTTTAEELNRFILSHRITKVEKEFVVDPAGAYWAFCVTHSVQPKGDQGKSTPKVDYREILTTHEFDVFSKLREVRKQLAEKDGVPVYAVATNQHLADMVRNWPKSISELDSVVGFGKTKIEKYGMELVNVLNALMKGADTETDPPDG